MRIMTIGFTRRSADAFFQSMRMAGVRRLADVRLNHTSQLAGIANRQKLPYLCWTGRWSVEVPAEPILAPTAPMLVPTRQT